MPNGVIRTSALIGFLYAGAAVPAHAQSMVAWFPSVAADKFTVQVAGPKDDILDFAACKGVWFAEQRKAETITFGNPVYSIAQHLHFQGTPLQIPDGTPIVTAIVYLKGPSPDGNRLVDVAKQAVICRRKWDWYR